MGNWKIVVPTACTNMVLNPSGETTGNYTAESGTTVTLSTTYSKFGLYSYRVQSNANNEGVEITLSTLSNAAHYVTMFVAGTLPTTWDWSLDDSNWTEPTLITAIDGDWSLYGASFVAGQANGSTKLSIHQNGTGTGDFYLDGIQVEANSTWTTFCDGDQPGCEWNGAKHASTSTRSAVSRAGGQVKDLEDDYDLLMAGMTGFGMPPIETDYDPFAMLPGGSIENVKEQASAVTLYGAFNEGTRADIHAKRQALVDELASDRYPEGEFGPQPVLLRYHGATTVKEVGLIYEGGFEGDINVQQGMYVEQIALKFRAPDPYWYEIGNSSAVLDSNDTVTLRYMGGRLRSTGQWDDLGLTNNPTANGIVTAICVASDGSIYFGGGWTNLDNGTIDNVVRFDPSDQSWNALVGDNEMTAGVYHIIEGPDGTIYLAGAFTDIGDANGDYIVSYDPVADSWASLGTPSAGAAAINDCFEMAFDSDGNLYVVGDFLNFADVAACDYIAKWNGTAWSAVGAPSVGSNYVTHIAIDSQDNIVVGGPFTNFAGDGDADYLARWDGTSWADLGSGTQTGNVTCIEFTYDDILYIGGTFTDMGGDANCDYICAWNGHQFIPLASGPNGTINDLTIAPDGRVFAVGTPLGGAEVTAWNGSAWEIWDADVCAYRIAIGPPDPTIANKYDIWIGDDATASREIGGTTTITNSGTSPRHPVIKISRSGGTSAALYSIRNETTGKTMMFNYGLLDGETLTIDCRPKLRSITSDFKGKQPGAILPNSDFGSFTLKPGANQITCFVDEAGSPTVTAWMEWRGAYKGAD